MVDALHRMSGASRALRPEAGVYSVDGPGLSGSASRLLLCSLGFALVLSVAGCASRPPTPDAVVTGVALSRERVVLPPEAVLEAALLDVSDPDAPPLVLGRQRLAPAGQPPFALAIPYPASRFVVKGRYEVRATVTLENRMLLATVQRYPVPQDAAFRHVSLQLQRMWPQAATADAAVPLLLTHWRLTEIQGEAVARPAAAAPPSPHLVFQADEARVTGFGGCNRFFADYAAQGAALRFGRVVSNITLCLPSAATEERLFAALAQVASYLQQGTQLLFRDADGQPVLRFEADEAVLQ
ncbi:META domain-containing protein [Acidovorax sp. BL-A-41-H1]|uniref:META domain-containing protein n=1 Tax=Acidovorax sp. BL-A-41-H1 TaxID=3421102 RepID=UPI003F79E12A